MEEKCTPKLLLVIVNGVPADDTAVDAELKTRQALIQAKRVGFKKTPDLALKEVLRRKQITRRKHLAVLDPTKQDQSD